jgi:hypothetical protein
MFFRRETFCSRARPGVAGCIDRDDRGGAQCDQLIGLSSCGRSVGSCQESSLRGSRTRLWGFLIIEASPPSPDRLAWNSAAPRENPQERGRSQLSLADSLGKSPEEPDAVPARGLL